VPEAHRVRPVECLSGRLPVRAGGHQQLVALPGVSAFGYPAEFRTGQLAAALGFQIGVRQGQGAPVHLGGQPVQRGGDFDAGLSRCEAQGGERAGVRRDDGARHAQAFGQAAGEQAAGSSEGHQRKASGVHPSFHAHASQGANHGGGGDVHDPQRAPFRAEAGSSTHPAYRLAGQARIEPQVGGEGMFRIQPAQDQGRIGDGGLRTPQPVACRTRHRPGALGTYAQRPAGVHPRNAAAAGAHRLDEHVRQSHRDASHLTGRLHQGLAAQHQAGVGAGAAHVEREQIGPAHFEAQSPGSFDSAHRSRQRERRSAIHRLPNRQGAAVGGHDPEFRYAAPGRVGSHPLQVAGDARAQVGLDAGGAGALVLPEDGKDLVAGHHGEPGQRRPQRRGELSLVRGVRETEQQADSHRVGAARSDLADHPRDLLGGEGRDHAVGAHALGDTDDRIARHQGGGMVPSQVVQRGAILAPEPEQIFEARGQHHDDPAAPPLQEGIGRHRSAVDQGFDRLLRQAGEQPVHRAPQSVRGILGGGGDFDDVQPALGRQGHQVGEGASHVHAEAHAHLFDPALITKANEPSSTSVPTQSPRVTYRVRVRLV